MHPTPFTVHQFQFTRSNPKCLSPNHTEHLIFHHGHLDFSENEPVNYFSYHVSLMEGLDKNAFCMDAQGIIYCGACKELFSCFKKSNRPTHDLEHELLSDDSSQYKILWLVIFSLFKTMPSSIATLSGKNYSKLPTQFLSFISGERYLFLEQLYFENLLRSGPTTVVDAIEASKDAGTPGRKGASSHINGKLNLEKFYKQTSEHLLESSAYVAGFAATLAAARIPNFYALIYRVATHIQTKTQQRQDLALKASQDAEDSIPNGMAIIIEAVAAMYPQATAILSSLQPAPGSAIVGSAGTASRPHAVVIEIPDSAHTSTLHDELDPQDAALVTQLRTILLEEDYNGPRKLYQ